MQRLRFDAEGRPVTDPAAHAAFDAAWDELRKNDVRAPSAEDVLAQRGVPFFHFPSHDAVVDAINKGQVYRFVSKPWNEEELRNVIKAGYDLNRSRVNNAQEGQQVLAAMDGFVGDLDRLTADLNSGHEANNVAQELSLLKGRMMEERIRYGRWVELQNSRSK